MAGLGFALPLAGVARRAAVVVRRAVLPDFAALARGAAAPAGRAVRDARPDADLEVPVLADDAAVLAVRALAVPVAGLVAPADLAAVAGADAGSLTVDIALAAAVSDFDAAVIALVAVFIACMAVDIVLADDVALVAAAVILVAALVTFEAADDTVRAAFAGDGAFLDAVDRVVPPAAAPARLDVLLLADLVSVLLAGLRRAAVRVVVRAGTDLPPVLINYGVLFHDRRRFTHPMSDEGRSHGRTMAPSGPKTAANSSGTGNGTPAGDCSCAAGKLEASHDGGIGQAS